MARTLDDRHNDLLLAATEFLSKVEGHGSDHEDPNIKPSAERLRAAIRECEAAEG